MRVTLLGLVLAIAGAAEARPRPSLTPAAAALLAKGPALLLPADNLLVPPAAKAKPVPFLAATPGRLAVIASSAKAGTVLAIDDEAYRLDGGALASIAIKVGAAPALPGDGVALAKGATPLVVSVEDQKSLRLSTGTTTRLVSYHRQGRWELDRPYVTPDGKQVLAVLRDMSGDLDDYHLLDVAKGDFDEISIAQTRGGFVPGTLRQPLGDGQVAIQMFAQSGMDDATVELHATGWLVFDFATRQLAAAPPSVVPGRASPTGKWALAAGEPEVGGPEVGRCKVETARLLATADRSAVRLPVLSDAILALVEFLPDDSGVVANLVSRKSCKTKGAIVPLGREESPAKWASFPLPARATPIVARVIWSAPR